MVVETKEHTGDAGHRPVRLFEYSNEWNGDSKIQQTVERFLFKSRTEKSGTCFVHMFIEGERVGFVGYQLKRDVFQLIVFEVDEQHHRRSHDTTLTDYLEGVARDGSRREIRLCYLNGGDFDFWKRMEFTQLGESVYINRVLN